MADPKRRFARLAIANQVFTPGSPIDTLELFSGRTEQVGDVLSAYTTKGQHVALYGERGVGKTSIASILAEALGSVPLSTKPASTRVACSTSDNFQTVWETIFKKLEIKTKGEVLRPQVVKDYLDELEHPTLVVIDELDRLDDDEGLSVLADTIKLLADEPCLATIVIVGVADTIDDLVGDHQSIGRALRQVRIPRMSSNELQGIIKKGATALELAVTDEQLRRIAELSEGLPHYTHALGLYASQRAIGDDRDDLLDSDIESAMSMVVNKAQQTILSTYKKATRSAHQDAIFDKVLLACALAAKDELGMFAARGVATPLSLVAGKRYEIPAFARHLKQFSSDERGFVLQQHGSERRYFYRFSDPMMQPFVILNGIARGVVSEEKLLEIKDAVEREAR